MTDTIREAAARAAEKWRMPPGHSKHDFGHIGFVAGYLAGYEAAKAEYREQSPCGTAYVTKKVER